MEGGTAVIDRFIAGGEGSEMGGRRTGVGRLVVHAWVNRALVTLWRSSSARLWCPSTHLAWARLL